MVVRWDVLMILGDVRGCWSGEGEERRLGFVEGEDGVADKRVVKMKVKRVEKGIVVGRVKG